MTYSIVARDEATGRFGIAIQTCWPFVGASCPWVESGVGAVVTQSFTEIAHGPNGLARLRAGEAPDAALAALLDADAGREGRQVGIVDGTGRSAAWTGSRCVPAAGHVTTHGVSVQANMMERPTVWPAMLDAYASASGDFVDRLLAALQAAEREGGDIRGRQSAALVVSGGPGDAPWHRAVDLRVDEHPAPLDELERLVRVQRAYDALDRAEDAGRSGEVAAAAGANEEAGRLAPGDRQIAVWRAVGLAGAGLVEPARALFAGATANNPRWPEFLRRYRRAKAQPELDGAIGALLGDAPAASGSDAR